MIYRSQRIGNFTVLGNAMFADHGLTFEAMGLLAYLLSKPDNWAVHVRALCKATEGTALRRGTNKIYALLKELELAGYVAKQKRGNGEVDYFVFDEPQQVPNQENPVQENPVQENHEAYKRTDSNKELILEQERRGNKGAPARDPAPREPSPEIPKPPPAKPERFDPLAALAEHGVGEQLAADWLTVRRQKRAPLTQTALDGLVREAVTAGIPVVEAVRICVERGWVGFKASWGWRDDAPQHPQGRVFDQAGNLQGGMVPAGMLDAFGGVVLPVGRTSKMSQGLAALEEMKAKIDRGEI